MEWCAKWIAPAQAMEDVCPLFGKAFSKAGDIVKGELFITAMGVYEARLNGKRVGDCVLAPGWTSYGPYLLGKLTNRCSAVGISPQPVGN